MYSGNKIRLILTSFDQLQIRYLTHLYFDCSVPAEISSINVQTDEHWPPHTRPTQHRYNSSIMGWAKLTACQLHFLYRNITFEGVYMYCTCVYTFLNILHFSILCTELHKESLFFFLSVTCMHKKAITLQTADSKSIMTGSTGWGHR